MGIAITVLKWYIINSFKNINNRKLDFIQIENLNLHFILH